MNEIIDVMNVLRPSQQKQYAEEFLMKKNRLLKKDAEGSLLLVVRKRLRWRVVKRVHDDVGHPALETILKQLMKNF